MFYSTEIKYQALHQGFIEGVHLHADFEAVRDASSLPARRLCWSLVGFCGKVRAELEHSNVKRRELLAA